MTWDEDDDHGATTTWNSQEEDDVASFAKDVLNGGRCRVQLSRMREKVRGFSFLDRVESVKEKAGIFFY